MGRTRRRWRLARGGRRRLMIVMAVVLAVVAAAVGGIRGSRRLEGAGLPAGEGAGQVVLHVVRRGDTLWGIAAALQGNGRDPRPLIRAIRVANGLTGSLIRPGQVLSIPTGGGADGR